MDDALNERMAALDKNIEQGREWPALRAIKEEIINLYGLIAGQQNGEDT